MNVLYSGVDHAILGNGGPTCTSYLPGWQRLAETCLVMLLAISGLKWSVARLRYSSDQAAICRSPSPSFDKFRRYLLGFLCFVFGVEMGYKLATQTVIYVLNPCHIVTLMQIILLCVDQRKKFSSFLFRIHLYTLPGATLALVFPVINTRLLELEIFTYYVQHITILLLPVALMAGGGSFAPEEWHDFSWPVMSWAVLFIYHFLPLQILGMLTQVNLNNIICPAVSDPFRGRWYRIAALLHQSIFIPLHGKLYGKTAMRLASVVRRWCFNSHSGSALHMTNGTVVHDTPTKSE